MSARNIELRGRRMSVEAFPVECGDIGRGEGARGPAAERCWRVRGTDPDDGSDIIGVWVYEGPDGTLGVDRGRWLRPGQRPGE